MKKKLKTYLATSFLYDLLRPAIQKKDYKKWLESGRPSPAPSLETQSVVKEYGQKFNCECLIETGTFRGDMINAQKDNFKQIYSIELDETLARKASKRFEKYSHIRICQGDSSKVLAKILEKTKSCSNIFWLDAHYSGGITAKGKEKSPIIHELEIIFSKLKYDVVLLIDDARNFVGSDGYPTIDELKRFIQDKRGDWSFEVKDDIIRIHPPL